MGVLNPAQALPEARDVQATQHSSRWVTAREAFWLAMETLRAHRLRSFLTLLGVVIATTTLIVVMSVINGMNLYIANHVANLGANTFVLSQFKWAQGEQAWLKARRRNRPIRISDYEFLKSNLTGYKVLGATADIETGTVIRFGSHVLYDVTLTGVTPSMEDIGEDQPEIGRYISDPDYRHGSMVCFIGQDIMNHFFPNLDPLEQEIFVNGLPFRVVGVAKKIGTVFGQSQDDFIQIPLTTFRKAFMARPSINISVQAWSSAQVQPLEDEVRTLMRVRRHIPYNQSDTFGLNASDTIMTLWKQLTGSIFAVTIGIVAVFMVVGGIVIMNIMLASVTERTHEIGIRKSLGARRRDILTQFVIESMVMAAAGGAVGVLLSLMISQLVNLVFTSSVPLSAIALGVGLSAAVGLFFGIYPARKASELDPIEALRMEM